MASHHASESSSASTPASSPHADDLREAVQAGLPAAIAELSTLVRIPSVSWDGFDPEHVRASAERVAELAREHRRLRQRRGHPGADPADAVSGAGKLGLPAVLARRAARNGRPTVLLYAHHDVQPEGDEAHWESKPFEPTLRGDRLYGRGAADDKAGAITHIGAIRALTSVLGAEPDVGIVLFAEGEEEFGSRSLPTILERYHDQLAADVIVVADGGNWDLDSPGLTVALRGAVAFNLRVSTLDHASHSGMFGGQVPDAMLAAIELLATLWNEGRLGRRQGPAPRTRPRRPSTAKRSCATRPGCSRASSRSAPATSCRAPGTSRPITVTGIDAPSVKNASNTLIPSVRVRISARVAPGQDDRAGVRGALGAPVRARPVRRAALDRRPRPRPAVPGRCQRLGRRGRPRGHAGGLRRRAPCRWDPAGRSRSSPTSSSGTRRRRS